eukprot:TRINITY_DN21715_c0_g1_i1.p1 TRINITY_DN21715_c0_g1~~TRINITY_DN21715_c0_g1_i1.p1  ORF type:complete len:139 (+),score=17.07 TRINITY_DN21715_c0_g1_i1:104-520(+)
MPLYQGPPRTPPPVEEMFVLHLQGQLADGIWPSEFEAGMKERYVRDGKHVNVRGRNILVLADRDMCLAEVVDAICREETNMALRFTDKGKLLFYETKLCDIGRVSTRSPPIRFVFMLQDREDAQATMEKLYHAPNDSK